MRNKAIVSIKWLSDIEELNKLAPANLGYTINQEFIFINSDAWVYDHLLKRKIPFIRCQNETRKLYFINDSLQWNTKYFLNAVSIRKIFRTQKDKNIPLSKLQKIVD